MIPRKIIKFLKILMIFLKIQIKNLIEFAIESDYDDEEFMSMILIDSLVRIKY